MIRPGLGSRRSQGIVLPRPGFGKKLKADSVAGFGGAFPGRSTVALIPGYRYQMTSLNQARPAGACWPEGGPI